MRWWVRILGTPHWVLLIVTAGRVKTIHLIWTEVIVLMEIRNGHQRNEMHPFCEKLPTNMTFIYIQTIQCDQQDMTIQYKDILSLCIQYFNCLGCFIPKLNSLKFLWMWNIVFSFNKLFKSCPPLKKKCSVVFAPS